jgi:hypothetical protein
MAEASQKKFETSDIASDTFSAEPIPEDTDRCLRFCYASIELWSTWAMDASRHFIQNLDVSSTAEAAGRMKDFRKRIMTLTPSTLKIDDQGQSRRSRSEEQHDLERQEIPRRALSQESHRGRLGLDFFVRQLSQELLEIQVAIRKAGEGDLDYSVLKLARCGILQ